MPVRHATAEWKGDLKGGAGHVSVESGAFSTAYNFVSRFETGDQTNPEELIGAAHAGCYSMALSADLSGAGYTVNSVKTRANVHLNFVDGKPTVDLIELHCEADIEGIDADKFAEIAEATKNGCPISRALASVPMKLEARLVSSAG
ncbi:OsmC family peroxiredoxin [bacterium]|nr:OsmC family peroxiredoxin [bacterium]